MRRERELTAEEKAFYDGFVDCTPDPQKRRNRDAMVRGALREFSMALGQNHGIRERTADDDRIANVIRQARELLQAVATPEPPVTRRRKR